MHIDFVATGSDRAANRTFEMCGASFVVWMTIAPAAIYLAAFHARVCNVSDGWIGRRHIYVALQVC